MRTPSHAFKTNERSLRCEYPAELSTSRKASYARFRCSSRESAHPRFFTNFVSSSSLSSYSSFSSINPLSRCWNRLILSLTVSRVGRGVHSVIVSLLFLVSTADRGSCIYSLAGQPYFSYAHSCTCDNWAGTYFSAEVSRPLVMRACVHVGILQLARERRHLLPIQPAQKAHVLARFAHAATVHLQNPQPCFVSYCAREHHMMPVAAYYSFSPRFSLLSPAREPASGVVVFVLGLATPCVAAIEPHQSAH